MFKYFSEDAVSVYEDERLMNINKPASNCKPYHFLKCILLETAKGYWNFAFWVHTLYGTNIKICIKDFVMR